MHVFAYSTKYGIKSLKLHKMTHTHKSHKDHAEVENCMATLTMVKGGELKRIVEICDDYDGNSRKYESSISIIDEDGDVVIEDHEPGHRVIDPIGR